MPLIRHRRFAASASLKVGHRLGDLITQWPRIDRLAIARQIGFERCHFGKGGIT